MASILEALEMAQQRNKERDVMNAQRQMPVLPIIDTSTIKPIVLDTGGDGGGGNYVQDTRSEHEKYQDMVNFNSKVAPVFGAPGMMLASLNDRKMREYEERFPAFAAKGPRFSQSDVPGQRVPSLFERIFSGGEVQQTEVPTLFEHHGAVFSDRGYQGDSGGGNEGGGGFSSTAAAHDMGSAANPDRDDGGWGL